MDDESGELDAIDTLVDQCALGFFTIELLEQRLL